MERLIGAVVAVALLITGACATRAARAPSAPRASLIRLIATNDFHGALEARPDGNLGLRGGAAQLAAAIQRAAHECAPECATLLLDGGDLFQGTPASNFAFGRPVVQIFNALGYAAAALGNHEFDWGRDTLRARMREARFAILGANVRYADGRDVEWIRDDTLVERGGVTIGIIGIASPLTPRVTRASMVRGLRFDDPAPVIDAHARALRARGAALVIVLEHDGAFCNRDTGCRGEIVDVAQRLTEPVDAIVSGHTHSLVSTDVKGIPIVQARSSGRAIAIVDLPLGAGARAAARREVRDVVTDSLAPDPEVAAIASAAIRAVAALVARPIATVAEPMQRRGPQNALGNFIADAQRAAAHADVAVMNNGGIRADLRAGPASYGAFFEVQPFGNTLVRVSLRGRDLRAYVETLVAQDQVRVHVSGLAARYDRARPPQQRVVSVTVGGAPLDDARTYTLAYNDFLSTGGEGLGLAAVALGQETLDVVDLDALLAFARAQPGGVVRPDAAPRLAPVTP